MFEADPPRPSCQWAGEIYCFNETSQTFAEHTQRCFCTHPNRGMDCVGGSLRLDGVDGSWFLAFSLGRRRPSKSAGRVATSGPFVGASPFTSPHR